MPATLDDLLKVLKHIRRILYKQYKKGLLPEEEVEETEG